MKGFIFEELNEDGACPTSLLVCPRTREALLVDPVLEHVPEYLERLEREGLRLALVVDTRTHADPPSGGRALVRATGCRYVGRGEGVQQELSEGDVLTVGDVRLLVHETPGPSEEALVLLMPLSHTSSRLEPVDTEGGTIPHHAV
jgi:glyoxylase-like metal-dependent hydrolase (beta-lactamase superfamily II)